MISSLNRTIVGLKLHGCMLDRDNFECLNRTIVGLKLCFGVLSFLYYNVWIEPLWDWNGIISVDQIFCDCVWIEPLWDWNTEAHFNASRLGTVCIDPFWDWNWFGGRLLIWASLSLNRTIVGLKPWFGWITGADGYGVWIEPLWDWNADYRDDLVFDANVWIEPLWDWN